MATRQIAGGSGQTRKTVAPRFALTPLALCLVAAMAVMAGRNAHGDVLPTAPQVVGGNASVSQSGSQQTVNQYTDRAIINWGSFSIGQDAGVTFVQPSASSVMLNRVVGNDPSSILGSMSANGQIFLVNPNGVFFGTGARIDTGGLVATAMSIADSDFMRGYYSFSRGGSGAVENAGLITIREGGYALLAADSVRNTETGQIVAPRGNVMLASADRVTIDTRPDGLIGFSVEGQALRNVARVENAGYISADGGQIALSARGARELSGMVVNNTGVLRASSIEERDGAVILSASSGVTQSSGQIDVSGTRGGLIEVTNASGTAAVAGDALARGDAGPGGRIVVAGMQTGLMSGANVDASGATGGTVRVGGEYRGAQIEGSSGQRVVSDYTYVAGDAVIRADGTQGQGGSAVVWGNQSTRFDGTISATGAGVGRGGDAEVSGKEYLAFRGNVDLRSASGVAGTLLLDPRSITITNSDGSDADPGPQDDPGSLDAGFTGTIAEATAPGVDSTISRGVLEGLAGNTNIRLEATDRITLADLGGDTLNLKQGGGNSVTFVTSANGSTINFQNRADTLKTSGGSITLHAGGTGSTIDVGNLDSDGGHVYLTASQSISTGSIDADSGTVSYYGSAAVSQLNGTRIRAGTVHIDNATSVNLQRDNEVDNFSVKNGSNVASVAFRSTRDLTINGDGINLTGAGGRSISVQSTGDINVNSAVTSTGTANSITLRADSDVNVNAGVSVSGSSGGNTVDIRSNNDSVNIASAVSATSSGGAASVYLRANDDLNIGANVTATGTAGAGAEAARVATDAGGTTRQTAGQIKAMDNGALIGDPGQTTHYATVDLKGFSVDVRNVLAESTNGRAQVFLSGPHNVTVASGGTVQAIAASQPGVSIYANSDANGGGDVYAEGSTIRTTITRERSETKTENGVTTTTYLDINKAVADVGGIGIVGNNITLGTVTTTKAAGIHNSLYGISVGASDNITLKGGVSTDSEAGVALSTNGTNGRVKTEGAGKVTARALALTGDRDKGIFDLTTDVSSLTVLGGKGVDIDNTSHVGRLTISALGRISDATTAEDPETGEVTDIPQTNKPVGGVRIQSSDIYLLSVDNRSSSNYSYDGSGASEQSLRLIADNVDFVPGTIFTKAETYAQFRPLTAGKDIQVAYAAPADALGRTVYTAGFFVGLLDQLHPDSTVLIGGYDADRGDYSGNIYFGTSGETQQIRLGNMEMHFETTGRFYNNLYGGPNNPGGTWSTSGGTPRQGNTTVCVPNGLYSCLQAITTSRIYIKDSYQQITDGETRNLYIQGSGNGTGGTIPPDNSGESGGGSGGGGGGGSGGGGGGSSGNGSEPGGPNAPNDGPGGGGNAENTDPGGTGTTTNTNNPGQSSGNPGGSPGNDSGDPSSPGTGTANPGDDGPGDDILAGGGELSGGGGGNTPSDPTDPEVTDPTDPGTTPGGEFSDPDPGTQDPGTTPGGEFGDPDPGTQDPGTTPGGEFSDPDPGTQDPGTTPGGDLGGPDPGTQDPGTTPGGEFSDPDPGTQDPGTTPGGEIGGPGPGTQDPGTTPGTTIGDGTPPDSTPTDGGEFSGGGESPGGDTPGNNDNTAGTPGTTPGSTPGEGNNGGDGPNSNSDGTSTAGGNGGTGTTSGGTQGSTGGTPGTGSTGDDVAQNNDGGFSGGAGTGNNGSGSGTPGGDSGSSSGDGTFSDGSPAGDGQTQTAGGQDNTQGSSAGSGSSSGSNSTSSSGSSSSGSNSASGSSSADGNGDSDGGDSGLFAGGASGGASGSGSNEGQDGGASNSDGGTGSQGTSTAQQGTGSTQQGSGSQQSASSQQGTSQGSNARGETRAEYPPCEDEGQGVKNISRAGQPNFDLLRQQASGLRLRPSQGDLSQQRADCARKVSQN